MNSTYLVLVQIIRLPTIVIAMVTGLSNYEYLILRALRTTFLMSSTRLHILSLADDRFNCYLRVAFYN